MPSLIEVVHWVWLRVVLIEILNGTTFKAPILSLCLVLCHGRTDAVFEARLKVAITRWRDEGRLIEVGVRV